MTIADMLHQILRDIRVGARLLAKTPLFIFFAAWILALAIGANISVFSLLTAVLARPLAIPQPDRFVRLYPNSGDGSMTPIVDYMEYRDQSQSLTTIGGYNNHLWAGPIRLGNPRALPVDSFLVTLVTGKLFDTIGLPAEIGRPLRLKMRFPEHRRLQS